MRMMYHRQHSGTPGTTSNGVGCDSAKANLAMKEKMLSRIEEMPRLPLPYHADNELLRFLDGL
jgi:hypothetical protein